MAEQFAFQQGVRQRRAVKFDEGGASPWRMVMDGVGDQLFPGAAFAAHQHGGVPARNLADHLHDLAHRRALADHMVKAHPARRRAGRRPFHLRRLAARQGGGGREDHQPDGLGDEVGDGFEKAGAGRQPLFLARHRLGRQHSHGPGVGPHQRHGDKRQVIIVEAQTVEKTLIVGDPRQHQRLPLGQHRPHQPLAGTIADLRAAGEGLLLGLLQRFDTEDLLLAVVQADHPVLHKGIVVQYAEHLLQRFAGLGGPAQHHAYPLHGGELLREVEASDGGVRVGFRDHASPPVRVLNSGKRRVRQVPPCGREASSMAPRWCATRVWISRSSMPLPGEFSASGEWA